MVQSAKRCRIGERLGVKLRRETERMKEPDDPLAKLRRSHPQPDSDA